MTLNRNRSLIFLFTGVVLSALLASCSKTEDEVPIEKNTVASRILSDSNYSSLGALIARANLGTTLDGTGPFTLFAPDDSAFSASGITTTFIGGLSQQQAQTLVLYHTLTTRTLAADLPTGPNAVVKTFAGDSIFITKNNSGAYVNGAKIIESDRQVDNGVIHKINAVLSPSFPALADASSFFGLDSLGKAIARVTNDTTGSTGFRDFLQTGNFTLFAPTDSAFINLLQEQSITDIDSMSIDSLLKILQYHIAPGKIFASDLPAGPLTMITGTTALVDPLNPVTMGPTITGNNNAGQPSRIVFSNILLRNAVIHLVDRVLLP